MAVRADLKPPPLEMVDPGNAREDPRYYYWDDAVLWTLNPIRPTRLTVRRPSRPDLDDEEYDVRRVETQTVNSYQIFEPVRVPTDPRCVTPASRRRTICTGRGRRQSLQVTS